MKKLLRLALGSIAGAVMVSTAPVFANTLTFQGVTFDTYASGNTLTLVITGALNSATGNWTNVQYLNAFEIKNIGQVDSAQILSASFGDWTANVDHGINNGSGSGIGCTSGGTPGGCFYQNTNPIAMIPVSDVMTFQLSFSGTGLNFDAPSLKVQFLTNASDTSAQGSLLSRTIPAIPEPEIYAMLAMGLGVLGWRARKKNLKEAASS
jgi:hypothetical protein